MVLYRRLAELYIDDNMVKFKLSTFKLRLFTYFPEILNAIQITADVGFDLGQSVTGLLSGFKLPQEK